MDAKAAFARYEPIRDRLPSVEFAGRAALVASLPDIADQLDVFVLSNSASHNLKAIQAGFKGLGFSLKSDEIISSRDAALDHVAGYSQVRRWGGLPRPITSPRICHLPFNSLTLADDADDYRAVDGFLFLGAALWTNGRQNLLGQALLDTPRPLIIANPDLVAPRLPYAQNPARIVMVGDTLHTDLLGGAARGWRTALVTDHGLFAGYVPSPFIEISGIIPDWQMGTI